MNIDFKPGEVNLKSIVINGIRGPVDIVGIVSSLSILETVYNESIYVELKVDDSKEIIATMPILGGEKMIIVFSIDEENEREIEVSVNNIVDSQNETTDKSKEYLIRACSPEINQSSSMFVQKSYNTNISNMVDDILKTFLKTKKEVDIQESKGIQKIIVANMRPFEAIDMLKNRAVSSDASSIFLFFENKNGYNFKTIEKLFEEGTKYEQKKYIYNKDFNSNHTDSKMRNILAVEQPKVFLATERIFEGGLKNRVKTLDLRTLKYTFKDTDVDVTKFTNPDGNFKEFNNPDFKALYGQTPGAHFDIIVDGDKPKTHIPETIGDQMAAISAYSQGGLNLLVYGDPELYSGEVIDLDIRETTIATTEPEKSKILSGKFMISAIRHIISTGTQPMYLCSLEVIKGGFAEDVI